MRARNPGVERGSGNTATFQFQIKAPTPSSAFSTTLYFRPAERQSDGSYQWIDANSSDGLPGNRTYDYFTVHVT